MYVSIPENAFKMLSYPNNWNSHKFNTYTIYPNHEAYKANKE